MTKKHVHAPGLVSSLDNIDLNSASWAEPGDAIYFYNPKIVSETSEKTVIVVNWGQHLGSPSITYDRSVSGCMGPGRRVGREKVCIDCPLSAVCVGGAPMSFQMVLGSWDDGRVFARVGCDADYVRYSLLRDAISWEVVPAACPGAPWSTDRVAQQPRTGDAPPDVVLIVEKLFIVE